MCPVSACAMASRSSVRPCFSNNDERIRMPGMQNPHCTPPSTAKASLSTRRISSSVPSSVTTWWPSICSGLRRQDSTGRSSTSTTQHPQLPSGAQPFFAETMPHSSRNTSRKCIPGSYEQVMGSPLRVKLTLGNFLPHTLGDKHASRPGHLLPSFKVPHLPGAAQFSWDLSCRDGAAIKSSLRARSRLLQHAVRDRLELLRGQQIFLLEGLRFDHLHHGHFFFVAGL